MVQINERMQTLHIFAYLYDFCISTTVKMVCMNLICLSNGRNKQEENCNTVNTLPFDAYKSAANRDCNLL